jgi:hypothetical protein
MARDTRSSSGCVVGPPRLVNSTVRPSDTVSVREAAAVAVGVDTGAG